MEQDEAQARAERLSRRDRDVRVNIGYTRFVRVMRLALPLAAVVVVFIVFFRMGGAGDDRISPVAEEGAKPREITPEQVSRNELLNPKFQSVDKKSQPYEITALRAIQGEKNKDLIMLEQPVGVITLRDGVQVRVTSNTGAYRQDTERFFLEGKVVLEHTNGYKLLSEEAHIDLDKNFAWSEKDVAGSGPDIMIDARGVRANGETGEIVFSGPAKLTLSAGFGGLE